MIRYLFTGTAVGVAYITGKAVGSGSLDATNFWYWGTQLICVVLLLVGCNIGCKKCKSKN